MRKNKSDTIAIFFAVLILAISAFSMFFSFASVVAAASPPQILNFQGRLANGSGDLLTGTHYFRFSIHNASTGGSQLWPSGDATPCTHTLSVTEGVFVAGVGDTTECGDLLDFDFSTNNNVYLGVQVSTAADSGFESLSPRQRITSAAFAQVSAAVVATSSPATQTTFGTSTPIGNSVITIDASSTTAIPLSIRAATGQAGTANLFQIQDAAATDIFSINASGGFIATASSTISGELLVSGSILASSTIVTSLGSCTEALETNASGEIICGTGQTFELTSGNANILSPTTTPMSLLLGVSAPNGIGNFVDAPRGLLSLAATTTDTIILYASSTESQAGDFIRYTDSLGATLFSVDAGGRIAGFVSSASSTVGGPLYVQDNLSASSTVTLGSTLTLYGATLSANAVTAVNLGAATLDFNGAGIVQYGDASDFTIQDDSGADILLLTGSTNVLAFGNATDNNAFT
ncbi:hypothetical protein HYT04_01985, partial [Candidatus Kaiserbacteria bacterium]|nr:hypothetical protein [Candidatus Kaiserbacteria bacterium]